MATLNQLTLDADGTISAVIQHDAGTGAPFYTHCNDAPNGGSSDWVSNDQSETSGTAWFRLSDVNTDFSSMDTLNIDVDVQAVGFTNDTCTLTARIFDADNDTTNPLTAETGNLGTEADSTRTQRNVAFGSLTGSKAQWNAAYIRFTWTYTKITNPDNAELRLFGCDIDGTYTAGGTDNLLADDISTTPVLDSPSLGQTHVLNADDISTTPVLDSPNIGQTHVLDANDISTTPVLDSPSITQEHALLADDISTTPVLDNPTVVEVIPLLADDISLTPVLDSPAVGQEHALLADDISTTPVLDSGVFAQVHVLLADDISSTPVLDSPTVAEVHVLSADDISTTPVLDSPAVGQEHVLLADDISSTPVLDNPAVGQEHVLLADDISTTPVLDSGVFAQVHVLLADDISSTPVLDTPSVAEIAGGVDNLLADDISLTPVLENGVFAQVHVLLADDISTTPVLAIGVFGQAHVLNADDLTIPVPTLIMEEPGLVERLVIPCDNLRAVRNTFAVRNKYNRNVRYTPEFRCVLETREGHRKQLTYCAYCPYQRPGFRKTQRYERDWE